MNSQSNIKEMKQQFRAKTLECDNSEEVDFMCNMFKSFQNNDNNSVEFNVHPLASFQFGMNVNNEELEKLQIPNMNDLIMSASKILGNEFTNEMNNIYKKKEQNNNNEPRVEEILEETIKPIEDTIKPVKIHFDITFQQLYNGFYLYDLDNIEDVENINTIVPNQFVPPGVSEIYDSRRIYHIIFNILPHDHFELKDDNLYYNYSISLKESLCGFDLNLKHINGKEYLIKNYNKIIKPFSEISIPKLGINKNDLVIKFFVDFPDKLDNDTIKKLELLFQDSKISS